MGWISKNIALAIISGCERAVTEMLKALVDGVMRESLFEITFKVRPKMINQFNKQEHKHPRQRR